MQDELISVARIAAALARQPIAASMTLAEISRDAVSLYEAARHVRRLDASKSPAKPAAIAETIASRYHAKLLLPRDPHGMAVGLKFDGAPVSSGFQNAFFVL